MEVRSLMGMLLFLCHRLFSRIGSHIPNMEKHQFIIDRIGCNGKIQRKDKKRKNKILKTY